MLRPIWVVAGLGLIALAAVTAACTGLSYGLANAPALFGPFKRTANLAYGEDPRQRLDVYTPANAVNRPVVMFWYGGSWQRGQRSQYRFVGAALASRGFVTVLPDYRLYPAVKFPQLLDDGARALVWVQQHSQEFGGDPHRIVLMGHSAGAHMAAFLALDRERVLNAGGHPEWIVGLVGLSGPYALDPNSDILRTIFARPYTEADWQPVRFASAQAPPALLVHGLDDRVVSPAHTEKLRAALIAHHVRVETGLYPGRGHVDTVAAFSLAARYRVPVLERTVRFIDGVSAQNDPSR